MHHCQVFKVKKNLIIGSLPLNNIRFTQIVGYQKNDLLLDKFEDEFVVINVQRILALIQAKNPGWVLLKAKSLFTWYEQLT
jgi:hypothetical protein